ncbi:sulfotransferase family protein [Aeoliella sp.]|uniref:sulfotransferase family protein n=1 Tax=Aeoliella sp. TaxID=2795800 RepID=UPI003CCBCF92
MTRAFIVGCPRSGTSVFLSRLGRVTNLWIAPETHFFGGIVGSGGLSSTTFRRKTLRGRVMRWVRRAATVFGMGTTIDTTHLDEMAEHLDLDILRQKAVPKSRRLAVNSAYFVDVFDSIATSRDNEGWVEKTPRHLEYLNIIGRYVPGVRFLHVVRDGRMTVASLHDAAQRYPEFAHMSDVDRCVQRWNSYIRITERYAAKPNHLVVNYHRFVEDPQATLVQVADFLGCSFHADDAGEAEGGEQEESVMPGEHWKSRVAAPLEDTGLEKFNALFDDAQRAHIEATLIESGSVERF